MEKCFLKVMTRCNKKKMVKKTSITATRFWLSRVVCIFFLEKKIFFLVRNKKIQSLSFFSEVNGEGKAGGKKSRRSE